MNVYQQWPLYPYGNAKPPKDRVQAQAWISAGGQNDAVVCHANTTEDAKFLRKFVLDAGGKVSFLEKALNDIQKLNEESGDPDKLSELIANIRVGYRKIVEDRV